jgi:hypothetical protein
MMPDDSGLRNGGDAGSGVVHRQKSFIYPKSFANIKRVRLFCTTILYHKAGQIRCTKSKKACGVNNF